VAVRFKLDENIPLDAGEVFRESGHDIQTVLEERLGGTPDPDVLNAASDEKRVLVTLDLDFADIRTYPPADCPGIWVLRPGSQSIENVLTLLRGALAVAESEETENRLWIVEPGRVRIHE
jgi:predicted nuclease of predicted toxin-antitoxin system